MQHQGDSYGKYGISTQLAILQPLKWTFTTFLTTQGNGCSNDDPNTLEQKTGFLIWSPMCWSAQKVDTAVFKMDVCTAQGTPLNVMWQPGWEGSLRVKGYMCTQGWIPLLPTWKYHDIVNWLYASIDFFLNFVKVFIKISTENGITGFSFYSPNRCSVTLVTTNS